MDKYLALCKEEWVQKLFPEHFYSLDGENFTPIRIEDWLKVLGGRFYKLTHLPHLTNKWIVLTRSSQDDSENDYEADTPEMALALAAREIFSKEANV